MSLWTGKHEQYVFGSRHKMEREHLITKVAYNVRKNVTLEVLVYYTHIKK